MEGLSAFVLAGGKSSRMGTDKALLPFGQLNLLQLALDRVKTVSTATYIVGDRERYSSYGRLIEDRFQGCGPLGGIHTALCATETDLNLVLSVDMPLMTSSFLGWLTKLAASREDLAVVPEAQSRLQPLCAIYRRAAKGVIEEALKRGDFKVAHIFAKLPTRRVAELELLAAGFTPDIFRNVNTLADYDAITSMWQRTGSREPKHLSE